MPTRLSPRGQGCGRTHRLVVSMLLGVSTLACAANDETRRYCEDIYPAEYYTPEERSAYLADCYAAYADVFALDPGNEPESFDVAEPREVPAEPQESVSVDAEEPQQESEEYASDYEVR